MTETPKKIITEPHLIQGLIPDAVNFEMCHLATRYLTDGLLGLRQQKSGFYCLEILDPNGPEQQTAQGYKDFLGQLFIGNGGNAGKPLRNYAKGLNELAMVFDSPEIHPIKGYGTLTRMQVLRGIQLGTIKEGPERTRT